jgi:hypothetical protein
MSNHLRSAREIGVRRALKEAGYTSIEDVRKQAEDCGLVEKTAKTASPVAGLLGALKK